MSILLFFALISDSYYFWPVIKLSALLFFARVFIIFGADLFFWEGCKLLIQKSLEGVGNFRVKTLLCYVLLVKTYLNRETDMLVKGEIRRDAGRTPEEPSPLPLSLSGNRKMISLPVMSDGIVLLQVTVDRTDDVPRDVGRAQGVRSYPDEELRQVHAAL